MNRVRLGSRGFSLVEMMVVLSIIALLAAAATVAMGSSSDKAYRAALLSDLRAVSTAQEAYIEQTFNDTGVARYASRVADLDIVLSNGVQLRLRGNRTGWAARATHSRVRGLRCSVFRGTIRPFPPATEERLTVCD